MKLTTMTDFVLEQTKLASESKCGIYEYIVKMRDYANFLKQPLELCMFVPCDEYGNVLDKYKYFPCSMKFANEINEYHIKYQQAKERCLFEGFEVQNTKDWIEFYGGIRVYITSGDLSNMASVVFKKSDTMNKTIEDLVKYNLRLTQTSIK